MNLNTPNLIPLLLKPTAPVVKLKRDKKISETKDYAGSLLLTNWYLKRKWF